MKILQINNFEAIGGGSDRVYQLTTSMLLNRGHEVATLSCGDQSFDSRKTTALLPRNGYVQTNALRTIKNIREFVYRPATAQAIELLSRNFKPDIAHLHIFYGQLSSSVLSALRRLRIPCVMTVHEYRMLCPISTLYAPRQGICERCAAGRKTNAVALRCNRDSLFASALSAGESWIRDRYFNYTEHIAHFFMVSKFCLNKHAEYLPTIREKSSVLYNFVGDQDRADIPASGQRDAPFLYAGRISHEKGVDLLCAAFSERPELSLRVAGDGPLLMELRSKYAKFGNIKFLGKLASAALKAEIRSAKFSVVPSEWYENNPMSILESFGAGTPVLGADIGGIPELVIPDKTGLVFTPSNKSSLLNALDQASAMADGAREAMASNALALIEERHSESAYYDRLLSGYANVIQRHRENSIQ